MKRTIQIASMIILFCAFSFNGMAQEKKQKVKKSDKTETLTCWASMDCEACKSKIEKNIAFEKGVKDLKVDLDTKLVTVTYRKDKTSKESIEKAIQDLGFKTEEIKKKEEVKVKK